MPPKLLFLKQGVPQEYQRQIPRGKLTVGQDALIKSRSARLIDSFPEYKIEGDTTKLYTQEELLSFITCDLPLLTSTDDDYTNTVMDKRMGQTERNELCLTCGRGIMECEGHAGAIPLPFTLANPRFWIHIVASLRMICRECGNVSVTKEALKAISVKRFDDVRDVNRMKKLGELSAMNRKCRRCEALNYIYENFSFIKYGNLKESPLGVIYQRSKTGNHSLLKFQEIEIIFSRVDKKQWFGLGFSNLPIDFLIKRLYVQPMSVRMREVIDSMIIDSPATIFYDRIVKLVYDYNKGDLSENEKNKLEEEIYDYIHFFMTGSRAKFQKIARNVPRRILKLFSDMKSIVESVSGKTGYLRGHAMAKRTDYSSRTVLGPAWTATFNEIGVPRMFSRCHTIPIPVTYGNVDEARKLWSSDQAYSVKLGSSGGKFYKAEIKKSDKNRNYLVMPGDIIRRFIGTGDIVNFNRQPTLDKYSYLAYYAVVENRKTIGLPSESTKTHNGDFDGDESNVLTPQSIGTRVEAMTICSAENNVVAISNGVPKAGLAYTSITSAYLLTEESVLIDEEDFEFAASRWANPFGRETFETRVRNSGIKRLSGSALFSIVFQPDFNYSKGNVLIENGILVSGRLTKDTLGTSGRGIVDIMSKYYSAHSVSDFLKLSNRLLDWYISTIYGFTVSYRDIFPQNAPKENLASFIRSRADFFPTDTNLSLIHDEYASIASGTSKITRSTETEVPKYLQDIRDFVGRYLAELQENEVKFGLDREFRKSIKSIVDEKSREIEITIASLPSPENLSLSEKMIRDSKENSALNQVDEIGNRLALEIFNPNNPLNVMTMSGSRGNTKNTAQIAGVLGQQYMDGWMPPLWCTRSNRYPDGSRCFPFFRPRKEGYTHEIKSTGFILNSFGSGISVSEIPFHIASSRVGLIDTSLKSQTTGAFQRQMIKYLEDFVVDYSGSVKILNKQVQFLALNGFAPHKMVSTWSHERGSYNAAVDVDILANIINAKY